MNRDLITKVTAIAMALSSVAVQTDFSVFNDTNVNVYAETTVSSTDVSRYFYDQLKSDAQSMYNAMYAMYSQGILKTGTGDFDLEANGYVTQAQIKAYANGDTRLLTSMGEARDAFTADHPEIFYVDFSYLTLRVTTDSTGKYHAYLGTGRSDNYFTEGFTSTQQVERAIAEQEARIDEIVSKATAITAEDGQNLTTQVVKYVHDELINTTSYRMEGLCDEGNEGVIGTAYGALVKGQAVCEGYAKAMKTILDRLGIPCLTVQGIVRWSENVPQAHMWNYVQIDGSWYGLDATWDDPVDPSGSLDTDNGIDGYENSEYLLVNETAMNKCHVASGVMSSVGYEFTYPDLALDELGYNTVYSSRGLVVEYNQFGETDTGTSGGAYKVSYNGMGYKKSAEQGKYLLVRAYQYDSQSGEYINGGWGYLDPDIYNLEDSDTEVTLVLPQCQYVEFAVTDIAPYDISDPRAMSYQGDPLLFEAQTDILYNKNGNYVAPPYVATSSPSVSGRLHVGSTYPISITFDETLTAVVGEELSLEVTCTGTTGVEYSQIENLQWDGDCTITFDFTPSEMWSDDTSCYEFQVSGLVGKYSQKVPNSFRYVVSHPCSAYAYKSQGYDWNVFGQPSLLTNVDFDTTDWLTNDNSTVTDDITDRLVLVTTKASQAQNDTMLGMIDEDILSSETYNINLTLCKSQVISTGDGVRVSVGFPEGYDSTSEGITFKAYHFKKNAQNEIVGVEEVDCVTTQYGLIITCDAFSPFAIVAVDGEDTTTTKHVVLSHTTGGTILGADSDIFTLEVGESRTLTIQADDGYQIESISIDGNAQTIETGKSTTITIDYDSVQNGTSIVDVTYISDSVVSKDADRNETIVVPSTDTDTTNTTDLFRLKKYILGVVQVDESSVSELDYNSDGTLNVLDVNTLLSTYHA